jgi:uncharacterized coiled-coil DUF342 family protein
MNDDQLAEIVNKHAAAARAEIEAENRKSAEQKEAETLAREIDQIAAQLTPMFKQPSRYRAEIKQLNAQIETKQARYDLLTGKPEARDWRIAGNQSNQHYIVNGRK